MSPIEEWAQLVSDTNWVKGSIIDDWCDSTGELPQKFAEQVGGITGEHARRLLTVHRRYVAHRRVFPSLVWAHFLAVLDWEDAMDWLAIAERESLSVTDMRHRRWASI